MPPSGSYILAMQSQNEEDDDICPVCESECTCDNKAGSSAAVANPQPPKALAVLPPQPLKIRLTIPSKPSSVTPNPVKRKPKPHASTTSASAHAGGQDIHTPISSSPFSAPGQPLIPSSGPTDQPKKRGRPPKVRPEQRKAPAPESEYIPRGRAQHRPLTTKKGQLKSTTKRGTPVNAPTRNKKIINHSLLSATSESDTESLGAQSTTFPTFVSAISDTDGPDDDSTSELSSLGDSGDDSSLEAEETMHIAQEENASLEKARVLREIMGEQPKFDRTSRKDWEIRPRKRGSGGLSESDVAMDSDTDTEEDDDEEEEEADADDEDPDPDQIVPDETDLLVGGYGWSDSENDDIELYYSAIWDSEPDGSVTAGDQADQEDLLEDVTDEEAEAEMRIMSLEEAAATSILSPFTGVDLLKLETYENPTFSIDKDWPTERDLLENQKHAMGRLEIDFEKNAFAARKALRSHEVCESSRDPSPEKEIRATSDDEMDTDDGETTDEDVTALRALQTPSGVLLYRLPTPPLSTVDPQSTVSPIAPTVKLAHKRKLRTRLTSIAESPKPADLLKKRGSVVMDQAESPDDLASLDGRSSSLSSVFRHPPMGAFASDAEPSTTHVVIDGKNKDIPSPFPRVQRLRRGSDSSRGRKRSASRSDAGSQRSKRFCQSPASRRSPSNDTRSQRSTPEPTHAEQITLDDVLDCSLMDSDPIQPPAGTTESENGRPFLNLNRWEKIPMGTFRRTRAGPGENAYDEIIEWSTLQRGHRPSDGFSYGSSGGSLMRAGPSFQSHNSTTIPVPRTSLLVSPVVLPVRNGEAPVVVGGSGHGQDNSYNSPLSHKQKRKERHRQISSQHGTPVKSHLHVSTLPPVPPLVL
ncbi:hypothetical protein SISSUDRAFT_1129230 [Sistotremastrum suecicum HHB10207 ss-3]|uniref:Uncharacterized protein n=1 Tax=Sistotremastrum suecicum HHB10207 ss-3 TaxID=1314776 RepID=A0A166CY96_9AGAM|nr:hypothetical protein SISSUDRAFT_1129230 [Sistotremastrum suecicum HHB10207 ss-3]